MAIINFDDLLDTGNSATNVVPNGYAGYQWGNFFYRPFDSNSTNGYNAGTTSQPNAGVNGRGTMASFSSETNFTLNGFNLTAAFNDNLNVHVEGRLDGNLVYQADLVVSTGGPTSFTLGWTNIDEVTFTSSGGTPNPNVNGRGTPFAIDDINVDAVCYCTGTRILTTRGEVAVEALRIGDRVVTASGAARAITWIGTRAYAGRFANANPEALLPVCFKAGSLADGIPARDLWVSPKHAMVLDGVLIPAAQLVNGVSIVKAERVESLGYWHVELDSHDVLIAEGAQSESFVDDGGRGIFHNAHAFAALYPDAVRQEAVYCAPRVEDGYVLEAVRRRLAERAGLPVSETESPGTLRGYVEGCDGLSVWGWAQDAAYPDAPVCLEVLVDGAVAGLVYAEAHRGDLGEGCHGFHLRLPQPLTGGAAHTILVRRSADGAALSDVSQIRLLEAA